MDTDATRREQLRQTALAYFAGLRQKDFDLIPYADTVVLRAPLTAGGMSQPLHGRDRLRDEWWAPLPGLLGEVQLLDIYINDALTAVVGEAIIEILLDPPVQLYVADRFEVDKRLNVNGEVFQIDEKHKDQFQWHPEKNIANEVQIDLQRVQQRRIGRTLSGNYEKLHGNASIRFRS